MPKRLHPRAVIFEQLCGELLIDPFEEVPVGRHHDADRFSWPKHACDSPTDETPRYEPHGLPE